MGDDLARLSSVSKSGHCLHIMLFSSVGKDWSLDGR